MNLMERRRGMMSSSSSTQKMLKKIATVTRTATSGDNYVTWYFTDEAKNCSELYLIFDVTVDTSAQFNVLISGTSAQSKLGQLAAATTFQTTMVLSFTRAATIGEYTFPIYVNASVGNTQRTPSVLNYLCFRPNSGTAQWQGTIEIWGWV